MKNVLVPTSDGVCLSMDLHVPDSPDWATRPYPVLLEYHPYRKDDREPYSGTQFEMAKHGYIGARLDCRGTGGSQGATTDEYSAREQQDGAEAVEWIAQQPWCTRKVGMFGKSYGGFTALQVAALQPEHLATIIPVYFTDDRYTDDCHYRGGCLRCYYDAGVYGSWMVGLNAMPPYPEWSGTDWATVWEEHLERNEPYLLQWLAHQTDGEYWRNGSLRGRYDDIRCPVFMVGGWRDGYPNPPLRTFAGLSVPKKVLVGPWDHSWPFAAVPGPRINWLRELLRWCDHWLKGKANGVMDEPSIILYMQGYDKPRIDRLDTSGYWRSERAFPLAGAAERILYLAPNGDLAESPDSQTPNNGDFAGIAGSDIDFDSYDYRPTVGLTGGLWSGGLPFGLPTDQRPDDLYSLTYTSTPLRVPLEIIGWPRAVLHVRSTAPVMAFAARLCDVAPDGTSALICRGLLNGTRRASLAHPEPMSPEITYELVLELDCTAWRFEPGHCIRLSVSSADFPNVWPTPMPGTNQLYRGTRTTSRLILPVVPTHSGANEFQFTPASWEDPGGPYQLPHREVPWEVVQDVLRDRVGLRLRTLDVVHPNESTEITFDEGLQVWASNRTPSEVVATGRHHRQMKRDDGVTTIDTDCTIRSTETAFHVAIELHVAVNGCPLDQRRWMRTFPRVLL